MRLAIIDNDHFEVVASLLQLFDGHNHQITVYGTATLKKNVAAGYGVHTGIEWIMQEEAETNRRFLKRSFRHVTETKADLLFISTAAHNHLLIAAFLLRLKQLNVLLTLHDINSYIRFPSSKSVRAFVRSIGKQLLYRRANAFHVLSAGLADYLRRQTSTSRPVFVIPGGLYISENASTHPAPVQSVNPDSTAPSSCKSVKALHLVIPGSIDARRRQYHQVFELLDLAAREKLPIQVTLLGTFPTHIDSGLVLDYKKKASGYQNLGWYEGDIIDQHLFDEVLRTADFIWMPVAPVLEADRGITEIYGQSVCSGNIGDIIRSARPYIAPSWLLIDAEMHGSGFFYDRLDEIIRFLQGLNAQTIADRMMAARHTSLSFTPEKIRDRYQSLFQYLQINVNGQG